MDAGAACARTFRTLAEAAAIAREAAAACADPLRIEWALLELLTNAIEHGVLGIGHNEKCALLLAGRFEAECALRLASSASGLDGVAHFAAELRDGRWHFEVRDSGGGFEPAPWLAASVAETAKPAGRGILLARQLGLADLAYTEGGRCVRCSASAAC